MISVNTFASCCGMNAASGWPVTKGDEFERTITQLENFQINCTVSNLVAILRQDQHNLWKDYLPKYQWRMVARVHNAVHDNVLYLWIFEANPERSPDHPKCAEIWDIDTKKIHHHYTPKKGVKVPKMNVNWFLPPEWRDWKKKKEEPKPEEKKEEPKKPDPGLIDMVVDAHYEMMRDIVGFPDEDEFDGPFGPYEHKPPVKPIPYNKKAVAAAVKVGGGIDKMMRGNHIPAQAARLKHDPSSVNPKGMKKGQGAKL